MTLGQFTDAILEQLFVRGLNCQNLPLLSLYAKMEWDQVGAGLDASSFAEKCVHLPGVASRPALLGKAPSLMAGACEKWLATHEAGHAIVGIRAGLIHRGVRFYGDDGFPGEAGFEEVEWAKSQDEDLLRRLIRIDVAGNIAQMLYPNCEPPLGGRLSSLYDDLKDGPRPTDFISADARAARLTFVLAQWDGKTPVPNENWAARRAILARAEVEAEDVLKSNMETLDRLVKELLRGPMTGTAVRAIVER